MRLDRSTAMICWKVKFRESRSQFMYWKKEGKKIPQADMISLHVHALLARHRATYIALKCRHGSLYIYFCRMHARVSASYLEEVSKFKNLSRKREYFQEIKYIFLFSQLVHCFIFYWIFFSFLANPKIAYGWNYSS